MNAPLPQIQFDEEGRKVYEPDGALLCQFIQDRAHVSGIRGPIGSGKTLAMFNKIWQIACEQRPSPQDGMRKTRWGVIRNTYPDLEGTTVKDWLEWFPPELYGTMYYSRPLEYHMQLGDVRCEIVFMALDRPEDIRKLRSGQFTGFYFNELQYIPKEIFDEAESRTGRFPSPADGFASWDGVLFDLNEPEEDHWLVQMTGEVAFPEDMPADERARLVWPKDWKYYVQPPALVEVFGPDGKTIVGYRINPLAENTRWLKPTYYPQKVQGKTKAWIDSRLMNKISLWVDGKAVWPQFNAETHVAKTELKPHPGYPVLVGLDFGRSPAAIFAQLIDSRWYILDECLAFDVDSVAFVPLVKKKLATRFAGYDFKAYGDPKGMDKTQNSTKTSYEIFESFGVPVQAVFCNDNDLELRLGAVSHVLNGMHNGAPRMLLCPTHCRTLKVAMAGKYHYRKLKTAKGGYEEKPLKDRYSNPADALQYLVLGEGEGDSLRGRSQQGRKAPVQTRKGRRSLRRVA